MKKLFNRLLIPTLLITCIYIVSCATFTRDAYRTLSVSKETYTATISTINDLYKQRLVAPEDYQKIMSLARDYQYFHNKSVDALTLYKQNNEPSFKEIYQKYAVKLGETLSKIIEESKQYLEMTK